MMTAIRVTVLHGRYNTRLNMDRGRIRRRSQGRLSPRRPWCIHPTRPNGSPNFWL